MTNTSWSAPMSMLDYRIVVVRRGILDQDRRPVTCPACGAREGHTAIWPQSAPEHTGEYVCTAGHRWSDPDRPAGLLIRALLGKQRLGPGRTVEQACPHLPGQVRRDYGMPRPMTED